MDDVDFMQEHSERDSATFFIDSSSRNRVFYATPSEYVVEFTEPLRNVYGLDILDASIPSTMYNIDYHNNSLRYYIVRPGPGSSASDYVEAFNVLAVSSMFCQAAEDATRKVNAYLVADDVWRSASPQVQASSVSTDTLAVSYTILHGALEVASAALLSVMGVEASQGSWTATTFNGAYWFESRGVWYGTRDSTLAASIEAHMSDAMHNNVVVMSVAPGAMTHDLVLTTATYVQVASGVPLSNVVACEWCVEMSTVSVEVGNYNINSLASTLAAMLAASSIVVESPSSGNMEQQNRFMFTSSGAPFILDMKNSTAQEVLGFDELPRVSMFASVAGLQGNARLFGAVALDGAWRVLAPGVVNMLGVRYVTLRCPEIEDHLHSSRSYGSYSTGVGVFKLASPNDIANLRFDFVNLVRKPFHPIGKMSRLTFRFEFKPGMLYDFKGINHQLLITIKFYSPPRVARPATSVLNPEYTPNYLSYLTKVIDYAERSDDDDPDADVDGSKKKLHERSLFNEEQRWDYSTSEEGSEGYGDSDDEIN